MNGLTDPQLLHEYATRCEEAAFSELVRRYVDFVYSAAYRMVRDAHLAEDVTQGVFMALSQSAAQLTERPVLSGWLHGTTQNLAANAVRSDVRRRAREQKAALMNELVPAGPEATWEEIAPYLDAALGELSEPDRDALLLRYFERKSAREMAQTLGTSEAAAQKRVSRAVDRLRELLARHGVTAGAGGLVILLSANAVQAAPAALALSITAAAALSGTAVATLTASTAVKTIAMTTLQKTLIATTLAAAIGLGAYQARQASLLRAQVRTLQQQLASLSEEPPDPALAGLQKQVVALESQKGELAGALARANADKTRLGTEREQARKSAALYQELVEQANSKELNPTNAYPSSRHVWAAYGRMGRLAALSKEDDSKLSPEEKAALETARMKALEELPRLVKATKQYEASKPQGTDPSPAEVMDMAACLFYGALNLDEQQFNQLYAVMQRIQPEAIRKGLSKDAPAPEAAEATKQLLEQFKTETRMLLSPEQARIFGEVITHIQLEPGKVGFNFNF
jgi:RNA polymerase sigma factor (sigma-70 family)